MDFTFNEQQKMTRAQLRAFLCDSCSSTLVREVEANNLDYSPELYQKLADLGWFGLKVPPEYGGIGGTWVDMAIFYEEAGRAMLPGPNYNMGLVGQIVLAFADELHKQELLPKIVSGSLILSLGLAEAEVGYESSLLTTSATMQGENYIIKGNKLFVTHLGIADHIMIVAREKEGSLLLFLVEKGAQGLSYAPFETLNGERKYEVALDNVVVSKSNLVGKCNPDGLNDVLTKMTIMRCAEMLGAAEMALDMATDYSKQRLSLDRPIGSFQSLQHKMADMAIAIDGSKWIVYKVAWMNDADIPSGRESAIAQLQVGQACNWVITESAHIHGAVSFFRDHDLSLYFRRVKTAQLDLGPLDALKENVLQEIGL